MPPGITRRERFVTDEFVVAIPHQDLVLGELGELPEFVTNARISRSDPRLGLSLIRVAHTGETDDKPGDEPDDEPDGETAREGAALTRLLGTIRSACAGRYDHWVPTIGKNRILERIDGAADEADAGVACVAGVPAPCDPASLPDAPAGGRGRDVKVAILDTRLYPHPDLAGRFYVDDPHALLDQTGKLPYHSGHATFLAGLIAQRAPLVELEIHNVLGDGHAAATAWDVATKIAQFAGSNVGVLTLSVGCYTEDGAPPLLLKRAVELLTPGVVIVAPAGNHGAAGGRVGPRTPFWPAALDDVVAVGAHDSSGRRAGFSPDVPWISLSAPGVDVKSTYLSGDVDVLEGAGDTTRTFTGYASWSGTSFAAATVSGEIAAGTVPGERGPREALNDLLRQRPTEAGLDIWAYDQRAGK